MPSKYMSILRKAVKSGIQRWVIGKESVLQDLGKFGGFCNYRLFHSIGIASLVELQVLLRSGNVVAAGSDSVLVNRRRNISVVGAFSRTISVPSVSPSFQVCGYHIDRALCDNNQVLDSGKLENKLMATCPSRTLFGECILENSSLRSGQSQLLTINGGISYGKTRLQGCRKASMSLQNRDQPKNSTIYGYVGYNLAQRLSTFIP